MNLSRKWDLDLNLSKIIKTPVFCQLIIILPLFGFLPITKKKITPDHTQQNSPIKISDYLQVSTPITPTLTAPVSTLTPTIIPTPTQPITRTNNITGTQKTGTVTVTPTPSQVTTTPSPSPNYFSTQSKQITQNVLPRVLTAVFILVIGWGVGILFRKIVYRLLKNVHPEVRLFVSRLAFVGIIIGVLLWSLGILQVNIATLATILGSIGLVLSLSSQDLVKNMIAGIYLLIERPFGVGDRITVGNYSGTVTIIDLRTTTLRAENGEEVIVPNSLILTEVVVKQHDSSA